MQVEALIRRDLAAGQATLARAARELCLTERTLQRRLKTHSVYFKDMVDRARLERAQACLSSPGLALVDVAASLGYAEQSSFNRACQRWFAARPQACRERLLGSAG